VTEGTVDRAPGLIACLPTLSAKRNPDGSIDVSVPNVGPRERPTLCVLVVRSAEEERETSRQVLARAGYEVLAAPDVASARLLLQRGVSPHAALVDATLPDGAAVDLVGALLERQPLCRAVVMTHATDPTGANAAALAGAHVYLRSPSSVPELLDAVSRTVQSSLEWRDALNPAPVDPNRGLVMDHSPMPVPFDVQRAVARLRFIASLSPAETMVAWRLLWGDSNRRIAELMACTERTVKFHVAEVLSRTGARSRAGLLRVVLEDAGVRDPWEGRGLLADEDY